MLEQNELDLDLSMERSEHAAETQATMAEKKTRNRATKQEMEARKEAERSKILEEMGISLKEIALFRKLREDGLIPSQEEIPSVEVINGDPNKMSIQEVIFHIQQEIKVPKDRWNPVGKFHYRTVEDIYAELKKLLLKYNCTLSFGDVEYSLVGTFLIRKVSATIQHIFTLQKQVFTTSVKESTSRAYADDCQSSGSADTYAHKMILQSLCLLDDSRLDPDVDKSQPEAEEQHKPEVAPAQVENPPVQSQAPAQDNKVAVDEVKTEHSPAEPVEAKLSPNMKDGKPVLGPNEGDWFMRLAEVSQLNESELEEYKKVILDTYSITEENLEFLLNSNK